MQPLSLRVSTVICSLAIVGAASGLLPAQYYQTTFNGPQPTPALPIAIGDFDNSGLPDLLMGGGTILLDPAVNGVLGLTPAYPLFLNGGATGDVNGDGNLDFVGIDVSGNLWILVGQGNGTFTVQNLPVALPVGFGTYTILCGDLNHDGLDDVVLTGLAGTTVYLKAFLSGLTTWTPSWSLTIANHANSLSLNQDFDGDGNLDLLWFQALGTYPGGGLGPGDQFKFARGDGIGGFGPANTYSLGLAPNASPGLFRIADVDQDGRSDIVFATNVAPDLVFVYGSSTLILEPPVHATWPTNLGSPLSGNAQGAIWHLFAYDADLDGDVDIVRVASFGVPPNPTFPWPPFSMTVQILSSTGYRTYATSVRQDVIIPAPAGSWYEAADFDQDGDVDLIGFPNVVNAVVYLDNTAIARGGCPGTGAAVPASTQGNLSLGDAGYFLRVTGGRPFAPAALGVSLGTTTVTGCGISLNTSQLVIPSGSFGITATDFAGVATVGIPLPNMPFLVGLTAYSQWFVLDPAGALGVGTASFSATPVRTHILW